MSGHKTDLDNTEIDRMDFENHNRLVVEKFHSSWNSNCSNRNKKLDSNIVNADLKRSNFLPR